MWSSLAWTVILLSVLLIIVADSEYVPLNSLTIASLYKEKPGKNAHGNHWWTDLQQKRQEYKRNKIAFVQNVPQGLEVPPPEEEFPRPISAEAGINNRQSGQEIPFPPDFEELFSSKSAPVSKATIERVTIPPDKYPPRISTLPSAISTQRPEALSTHRQSQDAYRPPTSPSWTTSRTTPSWPQIPLRTSSTTTRPSRRTSPTQRTGATSSAATATLPLTSLIKNGVINAPDVPGGPYAKILFDKFMARLTEQGLLRRVPFRHIKIVFFNLLAAIGRSTDERRNQDLLYAYLSHFKNADVDDERRFDLNDSDFKQTSELLDRLIFSYLSEKFEFGSTPRPHLSTITEKTTRKSVEVDSDDYSWDVPPLEQVTQSPIDELTSTTSFGGVASNTARPTTKSVLAELEFPSNYDKPKLQFMHDPEKHKAPMKSLMKVEHTAAVEKPLRITTTAKPMPPFYPQLVQATQSDQPKHSYPVLRPNFNNKGPTASTTRKPAKNPLTLLFGQGLETLEMSSSSSTEVPTIAPNAIVPSSNITMNQWNQIIDKLNYALQKLSVIEKKAGSPITPDPDILNNPQYVNKNVNKTDVVINVFSSEEDDPDYSDYFQALLDADSLSLDELKAQPAFTTTTTSKPSLNGDDDYLYLDNDLVKELFNIDIPLDDNPRDQDLPGVGSKNPVPLSEFATSEDFDHLRPDLGRFPVQIPIPVADAIRKKTSSSTTTSIGTRPTNNDRVKGKTKLTIPGVIKRIFGPPPNITDMRAAIPDFTSSGPVNIPSPLQLYGNIGKYLNRTSTTTTTAPNTIRPTEKVWPSKSMDPAFLAALAQLLEESETKQYSPSKFQLPSHSALPKPHSLAALEAYGKPTPKPIQHWLDDRGYQSSPTIDRNLEHILMHFNQNTPISSYYGGQQRFKSPPVIQPMLDSKKEPQDHERFTILTPQSLTFRTGNLSPSYRDGNHGKHDIFDMVLRHQSLPSRRRKKRSDFVLKPPDALQMSDVQLKPADAIVQILQNRPDETLPPEEGLVASEISVAGQTILQKPSAILNAETLVSSSTNQFTNLHTSLLGTAASNPLAAATNKTNISYNKLLIAAALSVVPTLVIAFPFVAASFNRRRRRRRRYI